MPRYFFHFTDGTHWFTDSNGRDLSGLRAARGHAIRHTRELKAAVCDPHIRDLSGWILTVVDASGHPVFALGFDLAPRLVPVEFLAPPDARAALWRKARFGSAEARDESEDERRRNLQGTIPDPYQHVGWGKDASR